MNNTSSLFDRVNSRPRPWWVNLLVCVVLLGLPFAAAALDGELATFISSGKFRLCVIFPTITLYIWLISPPMARVGEEMLRSLRPLIELDGATFEQMRRQAEQVKPAYEVLVILIGAAMGYWATTGGQGIRQPSWLGIEMVLSGMLMYAMLFWVVFASIHSTRINAFLHRQTMRIDIFNPTPFQAVGRQSLLLALVFIGGMTLSLLLAFPVTDLSDPLFWIFYAGMILVTALIFFLGMRPTHRVLVAAKQRELEPVTQKINQAGRELAASWESGKVDSQLAQNIAALAVYEQRLQATRTWPYDTGMLRTLFFSVFIPLVTILLRILVEVIFRS